MKPLVVIPARGGSKGVPGKNIKLLGGRPLINYTLEAARDVFLDSQIIVSTDDEEIKTIVEKFGLLVPFIRPPYLATDQAGTYEVLIHALSYAKSTKYFPDIIVLLQPTTPFRNASHIREAMELYDDVIEMVVSVKETNSNPYYLLFEENEHGWLEKSKKGNFSTRQQVPKVWEYNGGIYIIRTSALITNHMRDFTKVRKYIMDERSSLDIDTMLDWKVAEVIAKELLL